jgi:DNA-binding GntR family transcriptional regulator
MSPSAPPRPLRPHIWTALTIRDAIFTQKLNPGDRLVESKLARDLGIGVSSVREALAHLDNLGLVTHVPNRGTYVTSLTPAEIDQIYRLRTVLEPLCLGCAIDSIRTHGGVGLSRLLECVEGMRTAAGGEDTAAYFEWTLEFHQQIYRLAGDRFLERCLSMLLTPLLAFQLIRNAQKIGLDLRAGAEAHQTLFDAIKTGDRALGMATMRQHVAAGAAPARLVT